MSGHFGSVDKFYRDNMDLLLYLENTGQTSFKIWAESNLAKLIVLAGASAMEVSLCDIVRNHIATLANQHQHICTMIEMKAISRQFHTWFDWKSLSAGPFYRMFGNDFRAVVDSEKKSNGTFSESERQFLVLGSQRNLMIHGNFCSFSCDLTHADAIALFKGARDYCETLQKLFMICR